MKEVETEDLAIEASDPEEQSENKALPLALDEDLKDIRNIYISKINEAIKEQNIKIADAVFSKNQFNEILKAYASFVEKNINNVFSLPDEKYDAKYMVAIGALKTILEDLQNRIEQIDILPFTLEASANGFNQAGRIFTHVVEGIQVNRNNVEKTKERILSGELDPDEDRKVGQRPESQKILRMAKQKIEESKE